MADKIDQLKIGTTSYDIDLPPDATPSIASLTVSGAISEGGTSLVNKYLGKSATAADSSKLNGQAASYYATASHTHSAESITSGYLNTHPENSPVLIPFVNNDIAFLLKRGGSAVVKKNDTVITKDISNCFDGSPTYCGFEGELSGATSFTIELTLHKTFTWTNTVYVDFGNAGWRAKSIKLEVMNSNYPDDVWTEKGSTTTNALGHYSIIVRHTPVGGSSDGNGFNKIRYTFSTWNTSTIFRIAQIGLYNYGSSSLRETSMSRGIDDYVFRNITPNASNTFSLGSSSYKWKEIHGVTIYENGTSLANKYLGKTATAADSDKLDGNDSTYYLNYNNLTGTPIPGDSGEIKTKFRCSKKGYTGSGSTAWYYKLCTLPVNNSGNYASAIISGRLGGWVAGNLSSIYALAWNRDGAGFALLDIGGTGTMSSIFGKCDLVMYTNENSTMSIYAKVTDYFTFDMDIELYQSTATIDFDETYVTSPEGTLAASASTSTSRLQLEQGVLKINGTAVTISSKAAASGGIDLSLVTTGEKYTWNNKQDKISATGTTTVPVYFSSNGVAHTCASYAGGTNVTLNGTSKSATDASFYAPTSSGTSGQFLKSAGANASPTWETVTIPTKASWNYDDVYVKYTESQSLTDAQKNQARSNIGAGIGTITGISVNGTSIATSGVAALTDIATQEWVTNKVDTGYYMKAQQATDGTIDDLFNHVRYGSGYSGSVYINKKASGTGSEIPTGWYNYVFSPHRHGMVTSDNIAKPFYTNYTTTVSGVTCVFDENGFLTMNGTSTGTGSLWLCLQTTIDESRTYHFCIYNALNQDNSTFVRLDNNSTTAVALVRGSSTGVDVNLSAGTFSALLWIGSSGQTFNNLVIKPMLIKGDNASYGTILLFPMTDDNRNAYRVRCASNKVTSVRVISTVTSVSAGTGLSISGTASIAPTVNVASGYKLPTSTEWDSKANSSALGDQVTYSYSGGTLTITTK